MKTKLAVYLSLCVLIGPFGSHLCDESFAQTRGDARAILNSRPDLAQKYFPDRVNGRSKNEQFTRDPIRIIERDGEALTCNLAALFKWGITERGRNPMPAWSKLSVKAVNSDAGGLLATFITNPGETIFIRNYPRVVADGTHVYCYALTDGHFSYTDTYGVKRTVRSWNYGKVPDDASKEGANITNHTAAKTTSATNQIDSATSTNVPTTPEPEAEKKTNQAATRPPTIDELLAHWQKQWTLARERETDTEKLLRSAPTQAQKQSLIPLLSQRRAETLQIGKQLQAVQHQKQIFDMKKKGSL